MFSFPLRSDTDVKTARLEGEEQLSRCFPQQPETTDQLSFVTVQGSCLQEQVHTIKLIEVERDRRPSS